MYSKICKSFLKTVYEIVLGKFKVKILVYYLFLVSLTYKLLKADNQAVKIKSLTK